MAVHCGPGFFRLFRTPAFLPGLPSSLFHVIFFADTYWLHRRFQGNNYETGQIYKKAVGKIQV